MAYFLNFSKKKMIPCQLWIFCLTSMAGTHFNRFGWIFVCVKMTDMLVININNIKKEEGCIVYSSKQLM